MKMKYEYAVIYQRQCHAIIKEGKDMKEIPVLVPSTNPMLLSMLGRTVKSLVHDEERNLFKLHAQIPSLIGFVIYIVNNDTNHAKIIYKTVGTLIERNSMKLV